MEDNKKKKKSKLSQEEIKNLSTDELLSYIENEGKRKSIENENNNDSEKTVPEESKSMQQMRAKAKAFVQSKMKQEAVDPSCKFCNGSMTSNKFVHEKFCVLAPESKKTKCDSTEASQTPSAEMDDEDLEIEKFARNLEMI